eukprot:scaffold15872_cov122-Isochrysis_galbana.AAC.9
MQLVRAENAIPCIEEASHHNAQIMRYMPLGRKERRDLQRVHEWPAALGIVEQLHRKVALEHQSLRQHSQGRLASTEALQDPARPAQRLLRVVSAHAAPLLVHVHDAIRLVRLCDDPTLVARLQGLLQRRRQRAQGRQLRHHPGYDGRADTRSRSGSFGTCSSRCVRGVERGVSVLRLLPDRCASPLQTLRARVRLQHAVQQRLPHHAQPRDRFARSCSQSPSAGPSQPAVRAWLSGCRNALDQSINLPNISVDDGDRAGEACFTF